MSEEIKFALRLYERTLENIKFRQKDFATKADAAVLNRNFIQAGEYQTMSIGLTYAESLVRDQVLELKRMSK